MVATAYRRRIKVGKRILDWRDPSDRLWKDDRQKIKIIAADDSDRRRMPERDAEDPKSLAGIGVIDYRAGLEERRTEQGYRVSRRRIQGHDAVGSVSFDGDGAGPNLYRADVDELQQHGRLDS